MVSSLLTVAKGELPNSSPFDLTHVELPQGADLSLKDIWSAPVVDVRHGELWITYPFEERFTGLDGSGRHPELASKAKERFDVHISSIVEQATSSGIEEFRVRWTVGELLTNATQYGRVSQNDESAGLVRLEWRLDKDDSGPTFAIGVANPCVALFDPSRFARMERESFFDLEVSARNAHVGTIGVLSYLQQNTKLAYLWEMANGERGKLTLQEIPENAPDRPENYDDLMKPTRVEVFKFDSNNQPVPYSFDQFRRDIEEKVAVESVTVSCVIAGSGSSAEAESV